MRNSTLRRINGAFVVFWLIMAAPTLTVWSHSVAWVGLLSVWALVVSHADGWLIARTEGKEKD